MAQHRDSKRYDNIQSVFNDSYKIELIKDGKNDYYNKDTQNYYTILHFFNKMLNGSYQVPALGVSLDKETRKAMQKGVWLVFYFDQINYNSDLPFTALLVEVNKDFYGFNIIRMYNNKYEGRCFYVNLINSMEELYFSLLAL